MFPLELPNTSTKASMEEVQAFMEVPGRDGSSHYLQGSSNNFMEASTTSMVAFTASTKASMEALMEVY